MKKSRLINYKKGSYLYTYDHIENTQYLWISITKNINVGKNKGKWFWQVKFFDKYLVGYEETLQLAKQTACLKLTECFYKVQNTVIDEISLKENT